MTEHSTPYRWKLSEYVLRCEQGSTLREVVVEGDLDRDVIEDALQRWGAKDVNVLDGRYIEVPVDIVRGRGFNVGVKGRLLTVAAELHAAQEGSGVAATVVVVVDRDYDEPPAIGEYVLVTDGHSIENYALSAEVLDRFVRVVLGRAPLPPGGSAAAVPQRTTCSGADLYTRLRQAAVRIGGVRVTLLGLNTPIGIFPHWDDYVSVAADGALTARAEDLLRNMLMQAGEGERIAALEEDLRRNIALVAADIFRLVRGKDFICLLMKVLRSSWGQRIAGSRFTRATEDQLSRLLLMAVAETRLDATGLFVELRRRFVVAQLG